MRNSFATVCMNEGNPAWEQCIARETPLYGRGNAIRSEFERDYTRLLHSESYRRLKHKTIPAPTTTPPSPPGCGKPRRRTWRRQSATWG